MKIYTKNISREAFRRGMSSVFSLEIFNSLGNSKYKYVSSNESSRADVIETVSQDIEALSKDWKRVGEDISSAIKQFEAIHDC